MVHTCQHMSQLSSGSLPMAQHPILQGSQVGLDLALIVLYVICPAMHSNHADANLQACAHHELLYAGVGITAKLPGH